MQRERALVGFGIAAMGALGVALALARCTDGEPRRVESASPPEQPAPAEVGTSEPNEEPATRAGEPLVDPAPGEAEPESDAVAAAPPSADAPPATTSGGSTVSRARAASQPADLKLLGRIERELQREPPPEVHAMLRRGNEGASREELLGMARALPDLQLRVLALRWVDEVRPAADGTTRAPSAPAPGSANPFVKRVEPVR